MLSNHPPQVRIAKVADPAVTVGCGVLATSRHVVTCAHVVAAALDDDAVGLAKASPRESVPIDLPLSGERFSTSAKVVCWHPLHGDGGEGPEDIAILELAAEAPLHARPAPLRAIEPASYVGLSAVCFGFPSGGDEVEPRTGTCRGRNALGRIDLDLTLSEIGGGFGGTAVWEPSRGVVIGIIASPRAEAQSAELIPSSTLFTACPELIQAWRPRNPYKGLAAFAPEDQADFFGRTELTEQLVQRVEENALTTLTGPSGAGKSSLVGAGLLPRLAERGDWQILRIRPGDNPFAALAWELMSDDRASTQGRDEHRRTTKRLAGAPEEAVELFHEWLKHRPHKRLLIVVDEIEELFTSAWTNDPVGASRFAELLVELGDPRHPLPVPLHLLLVLRTDSLTAATQWPIAALVAPDARFSISPLEGDALRDAILEPASAQGVRIPTRVANAMIDELEDQPARMSLLQFALRELWGLQRARIISERTLKKIGGARQALPRYADGIIAALPEVDRVRARRILVELARPAAPEAEDPIRAVTTPRPIVPHDRDLLAVLAKGGLIVTTSGPGGKPLAQLAHAMLAQEWGQLATLLAEDRASRPPAKARPSLPAGPKKQSHEASVSLSAPPPAKEGAGLDATPEPRGDKDGSVAAAAPARPPSLWPRLATAGLLMGLLAVTGATLWQLQRARAEADRAAKARESAEKLVQFVASDLRSKLAPIGRLDLLKDVQRHIDAYYQGVDAPPEDPESQRQRAVNLAQSGDLKSSLGDLGAAEENYAAAAEVFRELAASEPSDPARQRDLSVSLNQVGDVRSARGDLGGALAAYQESQEIREHLAASDPSNRGRQRDLAVSLNKLGDIKGAKGDLSGALAAYENAGATFRRLAEAAPGNADSQRNLSVSLNKVGDVKAAQGDLAAALSAYQEGLDIFERLAEAGPSNAGLQRDRSASLIKVGDIRAAQGDLAGAVTAYQAGQQIFERLANADPSNASLQRDLSVSLVKIGEIKLARGDLAGALAAYEAGQGIFERLADSDPSNASLQRDLSVSLTEIGDVKSAQGDVAGALTAYQEGEEIFRRLADADPSNTDLQRDLSVSLISLGGAKAAQGDLPGALADYRESKSIAERLAAADPSNAQWQTDVVASLWKISDIPLLPAKEREALLRRALEILDQLTATGRLQGYQRQWPEILRASLDAITSGTN